MTDRLTRAVARPGAVRRRAAAGRSGSSPSPTSPTRRSTRRPRASGSARSTSSSAPATWSRSTSRSSADAFDAPLRYVRGNHDVGSAWSATAPHAAAGADARRSRRRGGRPAPPRLLRLADLQRGRDAGLGARHVGARHPELERRAARQAGPRGQPRAAARPERRRRPRASRLHRIPLAGRPRSRPRSGCTATPRSCGGASTTAARATTGRSSTTAPAPRSSSCTRPARDG